MKVGTEVETEFGTEVVLTTVLATEAWTVAERVGRAGAV